MLMTVGKALAGGKGYVAATLLGAVLVAAGWAAWNRHGSARYDAGYAQAQADMKALIDAQSLASASRLAALEHSHAEIARLENEKAAALRVADRAGRIGVRVIGAECPGVLTSTDASVGDGVGAILTPSARSTLFDLRDQVRRNEEQLALCRANVRELTGP